MTSATEPKVKELMAAMAAFKLNENPAEAMRAALAAAAKVRADTAPPASALRQMAEALERAHQFILNGTEFGYIRLPHDDTADPAREVPSIIGAALTAGRAALEGAPEKAGLTGREVWEAAPPSEPESKVIAAARAVTAAQFEDSGVLHRAIHVLRAALEGAPAKEDADDLTAENDKLRKALACADTMAAKTRILLSAVHLVDGQLCDGGVTEAAHIKMVEADGDCFAAVGDYVLLRDPDDPVAVGRRDDLSILEGAPEKAGPDEARTAIEGWLAAAESQP